MFANSVRHLSRKASIRASMLNVLPRLVIERMFNLGWGDPEGHNVADAGKFCEAVGRPVIANGGRQRRSVIEEAPTSGACDMVSMARPLLANPGLLQLFRDGTDSPLRPCTFCNRRAIRTTLFPLGCYDRSRFGSDAEMEAQILEWSAQPDRRGPNADTAAPTVQAN